MGDGQRGTFGPDLLAGSVAKGQGPALLAQRAFVAQGITGHCPICVESHPWVSFRDGLGPSSQCSSKNGFYVVLGLTPCDVVAGGYVWLIFKLKLTKTEK